MPALDFFFHSLFFFFLYINAKPQPTYRWKKKIKKQENVKRAEAKNTFRALFLDFFFSFYMFRVSERDLLILINMKMKRWIDIKKHSFFELLPCFVVPGRHRTQYLYSNWKLTFFSCVVCILEKYGEIFCLEGIFCNGKSLFGLIFVITR